MQTELKPLFDSSPIRSYSPGSTIFFQGEVPRAVCILKKGIVRVYAISIQGDEQIITFHVQNEFFPASWIFNHTPSTLFFYEAVTECEVVFIPKNSFLRFMQATSDRQNALLTYFTTNYAAFLIRISALEQAKAREKLAYTLYYLCQRYGKNVDSRHNQIEIELQLTHQNLASLVGLTRETTATEMNKLKKQGILTYDNRRYVVQRKKLLDLLGEDSFRGISIKQ